jgi:hypothetical protein
VLLYALKQPATKLLLLLLLVLLVPCSHGLLVSVSPLHEPQEVQRLLQRSWRTLLLPETSFRWVAATLFKFFHTGLQGGLSPVSCGTASAQQKVLYRVTKCMPPVRYTSRLGQRDTHLF